MFALSPCEFGRLSLIKIRLMPVREVWSTARSLASELVEVNQSSPTCSLPVEELSPAKKIGLMIAHQPF